VKEDKGAGGLILFQPVQEGALTSGKLQTLDAQLQAPKDRAGTEVGEVAQPVAAEATPEVAAMQESRLRGKKRLH
jgi:hypothetical protein